MRTTVTLDADARFVTLAFAHLIAAFMRALGSTFAAARAPPRLSRAKRSASARCTVGYATTTSRKPCATRCSASASETRRLSPSTEAGRCASSSRSPS